VEIGWLTFFVGRSMRTESKDTYKIYTVEFCVGLLVKFRQITFGENYLIGSFQMETNQIAKI